MLLDVIFGFELRTERAKGVPQVEVQEAIKRVFDGEGILFLGAGFSLGAVNLRNEMFMAGPAIADHFAHLSGLSPDTGLEDAAEAFTDASGVDALIREVQELFTAKEVCDYHRMVAALPWKRVYTTNYDNVFELASRLESQRVTTVTTSANIYEIPKDHRICIHLNGYVDNLDREKMGGELKLTDTSYVTASIADTTWAMLLRQDLKLASAVFFIGYSLYDLDIKRILAEADDAKKKLFFCIGSTPDQATHRRASRYGSVLNISTKDFVSMTQDVVKSYVPRDPNELRALSVREYKTPFAPSRITDQRFIDLLLWGRRSVELVAESLRTATPYYLERPEVEEAFRLIESGVRVLVVCSDLGNGKSMLLEGLRIRALERGFRVFDAFDHIDGVEQELEAIACLGDKVLVTIEEYQNWLDEIRLFITNASDRAVLILTARNAIHDVMFDDLVVAVGDDVRISELNIDILCDTDIEWVVDALDRYGLWGERAGLGKQQKVKYVSDGCLGQLHALLLKLLSSPDIGERFSLVAERIRSKGANYEPLLSIFILTLLTHPPTLDVLTDIWGPERIGSPQFRTDPVMKEFVNFNYYAVLVRSPIAAQYVLRYLSDSGTLVPILTRMAERIEKGVNFNPRYRDLFKSLMTFSSVQLLLPDRGRRSAVIRYYESLKNLHSCRRYPLFWLQYAIASLVIEDLPRAKTYFDTAYSLAAKREYNTFQIDNHYARFLMVEAVRGDDVSSALANYRQARSIIDRQIRDERRHYPYRVAVLYQEFVSRFGTRMDSSEIAEFASTATGVLNRIGELPERRRQHRYVRECRGAMKYVINYCFELKTTAETRGREEDSGAKE